MGPLHLHVVDSETDRAEDRAKKGKLAREVPLRNFLSLDLSPSSGAMLSVHDSRTAEPLFTATNFGRGPFNPALVCCPHGLASLVLAWRKSAPLPCFACAPHLPAPLFCVAPLCARASFALPFLLFSFSAPWAAFYPVYPASRLPRLQAYVFLRSPWFTYSFAFLWLTAPALWVAPDAPVRVLGVFFSFFSFWL